MQQQDEKRNENGYTNFRIETVQRLTKIETNIEHQNKLLENILSNTTKINERVGILENFKSKTVGIVLGISAIISGLISLLGLVIHKIIK